MTTWVHKNRLPTLKASLKGNMITFTAGREKVEVYLKGSNINKVIYFHAGKKTTITQKESHRITVGEKNWQRDVYHFLKPGGPAPHMRLGITKHSGEGSWSSLPHDFELRTEPDFEEIFFYILDGGPKKAIQVGRGVWHNNSKVDSVWYVTDKSFGVVPMGYHPVVGLPHVKVNYVWIYLCKHARWEKVK